MMGRLRVKNWAAFQHYKKRNPPWIKLHRTTLDDRKFHDLPVESRALAPLIWLLASGTQDGTISADVSDLAFSLRYSEDEINSGLNPLIAGGFLECVQDASASQASSKRDHLPETETEREEEGETDGSVIVLQILQAYPECQYKNEFEIPNRLSTLVRDAVVRDGADEMLAYTRAYARSIENTKYIMKMEAFYGDPNLYRRNWNANKSASKFDKFFESMETVDEQLDGSDERPRHGTGKVQRISEAL